MSVTQHIEVLNSLGFDVVTDSTKFDLNYQTKTIHVPESHIYKAFLGIMSYLLVYHRIGRDVYKMIDIPEHWLFPGVLVHHELRKALLRKEGQFKDHIWHWYHRYYQHILNGTYNPKPKYPLFYFNPQIQTDFVQEVLESCFGEDKLILGGSAALSWHGTVYREDNQIRDLDGIYLYMKKEEAIERYFSKFSHLLTNTNNCVMLLPKGHYTKDIEYQEHRVTNYSVYDPNNRKVGWIDHNEPVGYHGIKVDFYGRNEAIETFELINGYRTEKLYHIFNAKFRMLRGKDYNDYFLFKHHGK